MNWLTGHVILPIILHFGTIILVRNTIKSKFTYNGQEIAFDGESLVEFW